MEARGKAGRPMETSLVTDSHHNDSPETPSQGIFIGWLALALLVFALAVALVGIGAGATHGWQ
jgi:hypothetical protein